MIGQFNLEPLKKRLVLHSSAPESGEGPPIAAVAIIINSNDRGGSVLLIKRTERKGDPWSGQIAFPGGRKSFIDKGLSDTAVREAREEVGVHLKDEELLGHLPMVATRFHRMRVLPFVYQLKSIGTIHTNDEVAETFWVPLNSLKKLKVMTRQVRVKEGTLTVDSYAYDGHVTWGLTFRIINLLLNRETRSFWTQVICLTSEA